MCFRANPWEFTKGESLNYSILGYANRGLGANEGRGEVGGTRPSTLNYSFKINWCF